MLWDDGVMELAALVEECLFGIRTATGSLDAAHPVDDGHRRVDRARGEVGDERWRSLRDRHDTLVRDLLRTFAGREVKHTGDGVLAALPSPSRRGALCSRHPAATDPAPTARACWGTSRRVRRTRRRPRRHCRPRRGANSRTRRSRRGPRHHRRPRRELGSAISFTTRGAYDLKGVPGTWQLHAAS